ncbi:RING finger protein 151-like [Pocillopora damicornis]|uniref:RING finger protein 151-like n=1 Tax=Pocillopora damicornis TaxID=46731 RepID=UPI000F5578B6|nr:RING finger protein 151-like [Pocillopora damicornis]
MSHQKTEVVSKSNELTFLRTVDLECCICYSIVSRPVTLACGHSGCKNCMETWAESTATPLCPQCRATFRKEELRLNVAMDKASRDLPVKCNSQGCQWKGNYSDANDHLRHCPKVRERCPNEG